MHQQIELSQSQNQSILITPQFQQSLQVLQSSALELQEILQREVQDNPVLEIEDQTSDPDSDLEQSSDGRADWEAVARNLREHIGSVGRDESELNSRADYPGMVSAETLQASLSRQLAELDLTAAERAAAEWIIGNIDEDGLLDGSLVEHVDKSGFTISQLECALLVVQGLEPSGIGASSATEALLIQIARLGVQDGLASRVVQYHLHLLATRRFADIARIERVSLNEVGAACSLICSLRPFPARGLYCETSPNIVPDLSIRKVGEDYVVVPSGEGAPKLRISRVYRELAANDSQVDRPVRAYLRARIKGANWFIRCLYQREQTIRKIAEVIAITQRAFFERGLEQLRPMALREIAPAVGVHESTVSRAIANKYIDTPRGVYEFKFFLTPRIRTELGDLSTSTIRERLRGMIQSEDRGSPLSDQQLAQQLASERMRISRRTVTKYRESLGIPPSAVRRGSV
jgi:RNA polymerase sigma-54 factor